MIPANLFHFDFSSCKTKKHHWLQFNATITGISGHNTQVHASHSNNTLILVKLPRVESLLKINCHEIFYIFCGKKSVWIPLNPLLFVVFKVVGGRILPHRTIYNDLTENTFEESTTIQFHLSLPLWSNVQDNKRSQSSLKDCSLGRKKKSINSIKIKFQFFHYCIIFDYFKIKSGMQFFFLLASYNWLHLFHKFFPSFMVMHY